MSVASGLVVSNISYNKTRNHNTLEEISNFTPEKYTNAESQNKTWETGIRKFRYEWSCEKWTNKERKYGVEDHCHDTRWRAQVRHVDISTDFFLQQIFFCNSKAVVKRVRS